MGIYLILLILLLLIFGAWISSAFFGAPFQPSSNKALKAMIELSGIEKINPKEYRNKNKKIKIADLGSGNGKIVIEFAQICKSLGLPAEIHGFEINPFLALFSRQRIRKLGLQDIAKIHHKNFWNQDFSDFNIITSFQINYAMPGLEKKFQNELRKEAKVISNTWKFPNWKAKKTIKDGLSEIYLYIKE